MTARTILETAEGLRLQSAARGQGWRRWGPYVSDRQWGTVREDYSPDGEAWDYLTHDQARSRAYRWGEDGIAGWGDERLNWCLGIALWNERDPFLKERLFGLTNAEGNHGEDVKEVYYHLDGTPTHSYMRMLYKYPQAAFPYQRLLDENGRRGLDDPEFELADTGIFDGDRYFDVFVEYAKASPDDMLMQITVVNRGPEAARIHLLPQLWARNTWAWADSQRRPLLTLKEGVVQAVHPRLRDMTFEIEEPPAEWLFCANETNVRRLWGQDQPGPFKDGINDYVVDGVHGAVDPAQRGTKCAAHLTYELAAGAKEVVRLRFRPSERQSPAFLYFPDRVEQRRADADEFYAALQADIDDPEARVIQRQALAGMLWTKQTYLFDVRRWLTGDPAQPPPPTTRVRDADWQHMNNGDVISMPDGWEYPWFAAWDLAFHAVTFALIDPAFAKGQLLLILREWYMHPNGQLPAYEWAFGDANPPVHAWACWRVYQMDRQLTGTADTGFLERSFHKLMLNFTWWVNRKDADGRNVFQGGFLGLDNIGVFDRSKPLPTGGWLDQADGTAWMAMYTLNLLRIALELGKTNPAYEDMATKFFEHFLYIADAMTDLGGQGVGLWDEEDQFFYDLLRLPGGQVETMRVRSIVGLIPMLAVEVIDPVLINALPDFASRLRWFLRYRPDLAALISRWNEPGKGERSLLSLLRGHRMTMLLRRMLDEREFLSPHGVRSLSKAYQTHPFVFEHGGGTWEVSYVPGDSTSKMFGGNSNWRGPVWMPLNLLLVEALQRFHAYYGDDFQVECPVGSGTMVTLAEAAAELANRLVALFKRGPDGVQPFARGDRAPRDAGPGEEAILFNEFFHGDDGRGLGASHQTGWTGAVALLIHQGYGWRRAETATSGEAAEKVAMA
ncbi:MAG: glucosidase [Acetobacteraceae bacterium]|nr:glucosidase [Acetobacteraceae bacterium]